LGRGFRSCPIMRKMAAEVCPVVLKYICRLG
jgi:hypothetical protein